MEVHVAFEPPINKHGFCCCPARHYPKNGSELVLGQPPHPSPVKPTTTLRFQENKPNHPIPRLAVGLRRILDMPIFLLGWVYFCLIVRPALD